VNLVWTTKNWRLGNLDEVMQAAALFALVNIILLIALIAIYTNSFRKIHAQFTGGLLFFAAMFLVQNLITLYSFLSMFMYFASGVTGLVLAITIVQTAGLAALLWTGVH
jgi:hypothetical protein